VKTVTWGKDSHQVPGDDLRGGEEDQDRRDQRGVVEVLPGVPIRVQGVGSRVERLWVRGSGFWVER
jgi:hypothetical protein